MTIINVIVGYFYDVFMHKFGSELRTIFKRKGLEKYRRLTFQSKKNEPSDDFHRKLHGASYSIWAAMEWGLPTFIKLIAVIIRSLIIFYRESLMKELFILIILNILVYLFITKKLQDKFTLLKEKNNEKELENLSLIENFLPSFETNDYTVHDIMILETANDQMNLTIDNSWNKISIVTSLSNSLGGLIFVLKSDVGPVYFLLVIQALTSSINSLSCVMNYINQFNTYLLKFNTYERIWVGQQFVEDLEKLTIPHTMVVEQINIKRDSFTFGGMISPISQGDRILIKGKSGSGKSTFLDAMLGKINGITLAYGQPGNFHHLVVEFYQNIKEKMPTKHISIRRLFDNEMDNAKIEQCLRLAMVSDWASHLVPKPKPKFKPSNFGLVHLIKKILSIKEVEMTNDTPIEPKMHPFDVQICENHSGGEKTRLAIATKIYAVMKKSAKWFVLDEFEQGSDPEIAYEIIKNIALEFPSTTLIVVSHLERIKDILNWNSYYVVANGTIS